MNKIKLALFTAISIATASTLASCAGSQTQASLGASQQETQKESKSAEVIQQEQQGKTYLQSECAKILLEDIDCVVGEGESSIESVAGNESLFDARVKLAQSLQVSISAETERITRNLNKDAQLLLTQTATEKVEQTVSGARPYATRTIYDGTYYKVYTLTVINPEDLKGLIETSAITTANEEVIAQVKSPEVQNSFSKKISVFKDVVLPMLKKIAVNIIR
jgi:hypothetical protein